MSALPPPMRCRISTPLGRDLLIVGNGEAILASDVRPAAPARRAQQTERRVARRGGRPSAGLFRAPPAAVRPAARAGGNARFGSSVGAPCRVARLRRVRFVCRRRSRDRATRWRIAAWRAAMATDAARSLRPARIASSARTDASKARARGRCALRLARVRTRFSAPARRANDAFSTVSSEKARLIRDDVVDERKLRMAAPRRQAVAIAVALENVPLASSAAAPRAPCARGLRRSSGSTKSAAGSVRARLDGGARFVRA